MAWSCYFASGETGAMPLLLLYQMLDLDVLLRVGAADLP